MQDSIVECIKIQEDLDLDVLVHGEPERNDMVQYFGELLSGFALQVLVGCSHTEQEVLNHQLYLETLKGLKQ